MVIVNKTCCSLFIILAMTLIGCQSNVELPARLVTVVDNYPPNYIPDSSHIEYSRKINVVFKIKNVSRRNLFIPISDERGNEYHSFIKVSSPTNHNVMAGAYYWQNKSMLNSGDSISICVRLMELQLRDLGVYNLNPKEVIKRISFEYVIDARDLKESDCLVPNLKFHIPQNVKYVHQEPEGMCGI